VGVGNACIHVVARRRFGLSDGVVAASDGAPAMNRGDAGADDIS
jgi:hypothetical protein